MLSDSYHRVVRETVAPVLAEGVTYALRDQPSDPAFYMAEFLAARAPDGGAQQVLDQRQLGQECARLDEELAALKEQLDAARAERARRVPSAADTDSSRNASVAAASWNELRRLKRLTRSMKVKMGEPLSASDWPIPEGCILVQGGRGGLAASLCRQLATDFSIGLIEAAAAEATGVGGGSDPLGSVLAQLRRQPAAAVLLENYLQDTPRCVELLEERGRRVGRPTAVLLLQSDVSTHAARLVEQAAAEGSYLSMAEARASAEDWEVRGLAQIEAAARDACIPALRVAADGDFNAQMTSLLVTISSV